MKRILVQLYEIQEPREAERLIEMGVDRIGSVVLSSERSKIPTVREVVRLTRGSGAKSSLIPLLSREDDVLRVLDYYEPDYIHFCEIIPLEPHNAQNRETVCAEMIRVQKRVKKEFSPIGITRSIPIPLSGAAVPSAVLETILKTAAMLEPYTDYFMTDTLRGYGEKRVLQPVEGYVGITGEVCDWEIAAALVKASGIPVILAGGISPENAREAIERVLPAGVDSCTQTNARDDRGRPIRFRKDFDRVQRLLEAVRDT